MRRELRLGGLLFARTLSSAVGAVAVAAALAWKAAACCEAAVVGWIVGRTFSVRVAASRQMIGKEGKREHRNAVR